MAILVTYFGLRYVSWYKYLIVSLVFSHLGFWSGNLFLIAPFPDLCLLVPFFSILIGSSSYIEVTRISITSRMSSNFSQIGPLTAELSALDCEKSIFSVVATLAPSFYSDLLYSWK